MSLIYQETDGASVCAPAAFCSPNGLGVNPAAGRVCTTSAKDAGVLEVTATLAPSEAPAIYVMLEVGPTADTRNWFASDFIFGFGILSYNPNVDWVRTDVCHVSAACASLESLGFDSTPVNLGPSDQAFVTKVVKIAAAAVPVVTGDKIAVLLSFTNNDAVNPQTFSWVPQGTVTFDSWLPDRGFEAVLGRKRPKKQRQTDDDEALLLLDDEPYDS